MFQERTAFQQAPTGRGRVVSFVYLSRTKYYLSHQQEYRYDPDVFPGAFGSFEMVPGRPAEEVDGRSYNARQQTEAAANSTVYILCNSAMYKLAILESSTPVRKVTAGLSRELAAALNASPQDRD